VEAAIQAAYPLLVCCFTEEWRSRHHGLIDQLSEVQSDREPDRQTRFELVSPEVLEAMTTTQHPDGVVAMIAWPSTDDLPPSIEGVGLVLESIQDPGNLGTILRSASAVQGSGVFLSQTCTALTNPKVMRASVGAWFRVPTYIPMDLNGTLRDYQAQGVQLVATTAAATQVYWEVDYHRPTLILIGNEGAGLSQDLIDLADHRVKIPMVAGTESLNAAIAASILLFEGCRQRATL